MILGKNYNFKKNNNLGLTSQKKKKLWLILLPSPEMFLHKLDFENLKI